MSRIQPSTLNSFPSSNSHITLLLRSMFLINNHPTGITSWCFQLATETADTFQMVTLSDHYTVAFRATWLRLEQSHQKPFSLFLRFVHSFNICPTSRKLTSFPTNQSVSIIFILPSPLVSLFLNVKKMHSDESFYRQKFSYRHQASVFPLLYHQVSS